MDPEVVRVHPGLDEEIPHISHVRDARPARHGVAGPARLGRAVHHAGGVAEQELPAPVETHVTHAQLGVGSEPAESAAPIDAGVQLRNAQQVVAWQIGIAHIGRHESDPDPQGVAFGADALDPADRADGLAAIAQRLPGVLLFVSYDLLGPGAGRPGLFLAHGLRAGGDALLLRRPRQGPEDSAGVVGQHLVEHADQARPVGLGEEGPLDPAIERKTRIDLVVRRGLHPAESGLRGGAPAQVQSDGPGRGIGVESRHEQEGRRGCEVDVGRRNRQRAG